VKNLSGGGGGEGLSGRRGETGAILLLLIRGGGVLQRPLLLPHLHLLLLGEVGVLFLHATYRIMDRIRC
jgi:hypothetical protein